MSESEVPAPDAPEEAENINFGDDAGAEDTYDAGDETGEVESEPETPAS